MKKRSFLFVLALILLLLSGTFFVIEALEQDIAKENARIANETREQMEYIQSLQAESEKLFAQDQNVQNLLDENTNFRVYEIIHNESLVEYIYIIGFHLQKIKYSREPRIVNGTVYIFYVDLDNKSVTNEDDANFAYFNQSSRLLRLKNNVHKKEKGVSFDSSMTTNVWSGTCLPYSNRWLYPFRVEGNQSINRVSDSTKIPAMKYQLEIKKMTDTENMYLTYDSTGRNVEILSDNTNISSKYWKDERKKEVNTLTMSLPSKADYPIDWCYTWEVRSGTNQTIVFDIDMTADGWSNTAGPEKLYGWRFIIETPPNTYGMSEEKMMEIGVWPTTGFGTFYPLSTTIVKKGEWLAKNSKERSANIGSNETEYRPLVSGNMAHELEKSLAW
ncbi:hypothetical protein [Methanolobus psychrotolerans]|uniref:hypothetical protein n=1 Tax=Methanolobus psychrotolerans TaxID=1874706 RepID=UPI000B9176B4|nr:hypothetical protein [Methanolobus psychrotolerans]